MYRTLTLATLMVLAAGSAASAQTINPPNFIAEGGTGGGPLVYDPPHTQVLSGGQTINVIRLSATALTTVGSAYQNDLRLEITAPSGLTLSLGNGLANWTAPLISGTGPAVSGAAQSIDAYYTFEAGEIDGLWTVNARNMWSSGQVIWNNIEITPLSLKVGACCLPDGSCNELFEIVCLDQGGTFGGAGIDCTMIPPCPQPPSGACCTPSGCVIANSFQCNDQGGVYYGDGTDCGASNCGVFHFEMEPNNTKGEANAVILANGESIVGTSTASTGTGDPNSPDYFLIQTLAATPGIYRHRMTLNNAATPGGSAWIRAVSQAAVPAGVWPCSIGTQGTTADSAGQTHIPDGNDRINYWYGFGKQEQVYYRVSGVATTTGVYVSTLETTAVEPTNLGSFDAGVITITTANQGHTNDTSLRIFDSNFEPVFGFSNDRGSINGGHTANSTNVSFLRREYPAGTYYMALTIGTLSTNQGAPCDDNIRSGVLADFANVAFNVGTATTTDVSFSITDGSGPQSFVADRGGRGQIAWYRFDVTGTITDGACCFGNGDCTVLGELACLAQGGAYQGDNTTCATNPCPQPGACCVPSGCLVALPAVCLALGGDYKGPNTECATANCPPATVSNIIGFNFATAAHNADPQNWNRISTNNSPLLNAMDDTGAPTAVGLEWGGGTFSFIGNSAVAGDAVPQHSYSLSGMNGYAFRSSAAPMSFTVTGLNPGATYEYWFVAHRASLAMSNFVQVSEGDTLNAITFSQTITSGANNGRFIVNDTIADNTMFWDSLLKSTTSSSAGTITFNVAAAVSGDATSVGAIAIREVLGSEPCYANCDGSTSEPILNVDDFTCFINEFAGSLGLPYEQQVSSYANCDGSTTAPVLNVDDFTCFINAFAAGCP